MRVVVAVRIKIHLSVLSLLQNRSLRDRLLDIPKQYRYRFTTMQPAARSTLVDLVQEHLSDIVRDAVAVQRHSKRARLHEGIVRRRLHAADVNMALQLAGSEKLYATAIVPPNPEDATKGVPLADFLRTSSERMPAPPSEVACHLQWLAVDGTNVQSTAGTTGAAATTNKTTTSGSTGDAAAADPSQQQPQQQQDGSLRVHQLQSRLLSEDLQLYYSRVTAAMERGSATQVAREQQDSVLASVASDAGLQELVPFLVRYCQQELFRHIAQTTDNDDGSNRTSTSTSTTTSSQHCRTLVRLALALLRNPHLHTELHLHELLPALVTCVVAQRLPAHEHWALRSEAAVCLYTACDLFGSEYVTLQPRVLETLWEATQGESLPSRYGGTVAIALFGSRAVDAFLLPSILASWEEWEEKLQSSTTSVETMAEIQMCQQASLDALCIFLRNVSAAEKSTRLDRIELEEILGDRLVALEGDANEYAMCVV